MKTNYQDILLDNRKKIIDLSCQDIIFSKPIISLNETGIIFPNSITAIQGKKGVHKSRITELFVAIFISILEIYQRSYLGFTINPEYENKVFALYVDTERNQRDQLPFALQKIKQKAGYSVDVWPKNLDCLSLINIPRNSRFDVLQRYIDNVRNTYPDYHLVTVMDVVTDCVENFNDVKESMKLIDMMNELINQQNASFLNVIHENPGAGSDKARGHTGTEMINKASQVIQISFVGEEKQVIMLKFLHSRNTRPIEPLFLRYDEETKGLVLADPAFIQMAKEEQQEKAPLSQVRTWLNEKLIGQMSKSKIMDTLIADLGCSPRTLEDRLKTLVDEGFIQKTKNGNAVIYELKTPF